MEKTMSTLFIIEGNIGAGKSTFLNLLKEELHIDVVPEPTERWRSVGTQNNLLDLFYKDTQRWAYTFQSFAFVSRIQAFLEHLSTHGGRTITVLERSVYSDRYCFAKNCFESGTMSLLEWELYKEWFSWLVENYTPKPDGFIYLQTDPHVCYQRLKKRNRREEMGVSLSYLELLHAKHESWLLLKEDIAGSLATTPVLILDCNREFENDTSMRRRLIEQVADFISLVTKKQKIEPYPSKFKIARI